MEMVRKNDKLGGRPIW